MSPDYWKYAEENNIHIQFTRDNGQQGYRVTSKKYPDITFFYEYLGNAIKHIEIAIKERDKFEEKMNGGKPDREKMDRMEKEQEEAVKVAKRLLGEDNLDEKMSAGSPKRKVDDGSSITKDELAKMEELRQFFGVGNVAHDEQQPAFMPLSSDYLKQEGERVSAEKYIEAQKRFKEINDSCKQPVSKQLTTDEKLQVALDCFKQPDLGSKERPVELILFCPICGERHIDGGECAHRGHRSHLCLKCGFVWMPADVYTVGVQFLPSMVKEVKEVK